MDNLSYKKLLDEYQKTFNINVPFILSSLHELNKSGGLIYHEGYLVDYIFKLNSGCSCNEIKNFEKNIGYSLPEDYKQFISYANGLSLSEYIGSWCLDITSILEIKKHSGTFIIKILLSSHNFMTAIFMR